MRGPKAVMRFFKLLTIPRKIKKLNPRNAAHQHHQHWFSSIPRSLFEPGVEAQDNSSKSRYPAINPLRGSRLSENRLLRDALKLLTALLLLLVTPAVLAAAPVKPVPAPVPCALNTAHLHAQINGAINEEIRWQATQMSCEGLPRADGGFRLSFSGPYSAGTLTVLFGIPDLTAGQSTHALPVNLTLITSLGPIYGTRGTGKCTLDEVTQSLLPGQTKARTWQIEARGFCLDPARAVGGDDSVLVTTFELIGLLSEEPQT